MGALKRRNPLTESFLVQLDVDLEALAARIPKLKQAFPRNNADANMVGPEPCLDPSSANSNQISMYSSAAGAIYLASAHRHQTCVMNREDRAPTTTNRDLRIL